MLQRTLVLAQKTADEAIAEAQQRARTMLEESETKAHTLVTEAEETSRRIAENERQRLESEVQDLSSRRDTLSADVEALEKYEREYRSRLRKAIETELDSLGKFTGPQGQRPKMHDVNVPPPREAIANSGRSGAPSPNASPSKAAPPAPSVPTAEIGSVDPFPKPPAEPPRPTPAPAPEPSWPAADPTADEPVPKPQVGNAPGLADFVPADAPLEPEVLDDDAFFATLREAVRDDAPLGPRRRGRRHLRRRQPRAAQKVPPPRWSACDLLQSNRRRVSADVELRRRHPARHPPSRATPRRAPRPRSSARVAAPRRQLVTAHSVRARSLISSPDALRRSLSFRASSREAFAPKVVVEGGVERDGVRTVPGERELCVRRRSHLDLVGTDLDGVPSPSSIR
jgi:hypothetical protein